MGDGFSLTSFKNARDILLKFRDDYASAYREFHWPHLQNFNWAYDWFDHYASTADRTALWVTRCLNGTWVDEKISFKEISERSSRLAKHLQRLGFSRGDRVAVMLPNVVPLWEMTLALMKLGAVIVPTATQATEVELTDRLQRGQVKGMLTDEAGAEKFDMLGPSNILRLTTGPAREGWLAYDDYKSEPELLANDGRTHARDPLWLYFTSGTTAKPKLVLHTHETYPVGHLSTMYWIGIRENSSHQNISSPGWAKHAWSSFYAPWNAGATIIAHDYSRFDASETLAVLERCGVTSVCAPPTVWRMLILNDLGAKPSRLTDMVGAGEPLNPEVIETISAAWGLQIRDGFGQTETSLQIGNSPQQKIKLGSMGRPMPGFQPVLLDHKGREATEGEIALKLDPRPTGLMIEYSDDLERTAAAMADGYYRTGDEAAIDADGYFLYVGRGDDVFKSSDYRISPFELESVLIEHDAVAEAAIIPSPDPLRLNVPKAIVVTTPNQTPSRDLAKSIFDFCNAKLPPFKRIRRLEFAPLPKTISGKIRRVQLRALENKLRKTNTRGEQEYWLEDFIND